MSFALILQLIQASLALVPGILQAIQAAELLFAPIPQSGPAKLAVVVGATQAVISTIPNGIISPERAAEIATKVAGITVSLANSTTLFAHAGTALKK